MVKLGSMKYICAENYLWKMNHYPLALQIIEGQSNATDCWPHFHLSAEVKDHPVKLEATRIYCSESHRSCFLNGEYC